MFKGLKNKKETLIIKEIFIQLKTCKLEETLEWFVVELALQLLVVGNLSNCFHEIFLNHVFSFRAAKNILVNKNGKMKLF